ncbi:hypothetical protein FRC12_005308 [Ceratobasidium sp. 428]|nr:hypothetical protein FRC12_005308 [Ceratobasidium sp. 428]
MVVTLHPAGDAGCSPELQRLQSMCSTKAHVLQSAPKRLGELWIAGSNPPNPETLEPKSTLPM